MQLFSWRIGQALAYAGARITSTNTDGLYSVLESELNNKILAHEAESINVQIDPEPTYLISKDTNNRIEMDPDTGNIVGASGGSLACRKGPSVTKSLTHPAAIDWALTEYLVVAAMHYKGLSIESDFDDKIGMNILKSMKDKFEPVHLMRMFQNVIASSIGSINYIFGTTDDKPGQPIILQHYNRVFIMKDGTPNTMHLHSANARVVTDKQQKRRIADNERLQQHDPLSVQVLNANGVTLSSIPSNKEAVVKKVTNIEDTWFMYICNKDLHFLSDEETAFILDNLDYDKYLTLLRDSFENNWRNHMPKGYDEQSAVSQNEQPDNNNTTTDETTSVVETIVEPVTESTESSNPVAEPVKTEPATETVNGTIQSDSEQYNDNCSSDCSDADNQTPADQSDSLIVNAEPSDINNNSVAEKSEESTLDTLESAVSETCASTEMQAEMQANSPSTESVSNDSSPVASILDDSKSVISNLSEADIRRIIDTSEIALTGLNEQRAIFTFKTKDPELVERLCKLLY